MGKIRRKFDAHFKTRICETIRSGLSNINEVCREYQLSRSVVERWLSAFDEGSLNERGSSREKELERENEQLKAKVGEDIRGLERRRITPYLESPLRDDRTVVSKRYSNGRLDRERATPTRH